MGAIAQLSESTISVEPGRSTTITLTIRNNGTVVDRFTFEALGDAASTVTFAPLSLSLFPEASGTVNIIVSPPRLPTVPAGPIPFAVRVVSSEDSDGSVVEEGTIHVGAFSDITAELIPRIARGRRSARAQLAVDNRSNCGYRAELSGSDPKSLLAFSFSPAIIDVAPGEAVFTKLSIRPSSHFWRGTAKTHPFRVTLRDLAAGPASGDTPTAGGAGATGASPAGSSPPPAGGAASGTTAVLTKAPSPHKEEIGAEGSMLQEPILPRWLLAAVAALIALVVLLVILWFTLLKPQIRSTAQSEVNKQLAASGITSTPTPSGTSPSGSKSGGSGGTSSGSAGGATSAVSTPGSGGSGSSTASSGLTVNGSLLAVGNGTFSYTVPTGRTLEITDILVENSAGDTGNVAVSRSGTLLMEWAMANFRDIDYHWITPTVFGPGTQLQLVVTGCTAACTPGIYYAGHLVTG
jgi:preprotein translocase subunit YajC